MLDILEAIIFEVTGKQGLTLDTDFIRDLELDSFDIVNIIGRFEERFEMDIPIRDIWNLNQVKDVIEYMKSRGLEDLV